MDDKKNKQYKEYDEITNAPILDDHEYDGIQELDNNMPTWWRYLFYFTIIFSIGYMVRYHVLKTAPLQADEYLAEFEHVEEEIALPTNEAMELIVMTSEEDLSAGAEIYKVNCAVCHLAEGQGLVGPNLTDDYWLHGGSYEDIVHIINEGVPVKGMIAWKNQLTSTQIEQVASFITTLHGTNPPNPKAPEGEIYEPEM